MLNTAEKVHAGNKITTHQDHANYNYLTNAWNMSKGQLIRQMELMQMEINRSKTNEHLLENENRRLRDEVIDLRMEEIKKYRDTKDAIMQIA